MISIRWNWTNQTELYISYALTAFISKQKLKLYKKEMQVLDKILVVKICYECSINCVRWTPIRNLDWESIVKCCLWCSVRLCVSILILSLCKEPTNQIKKYFLVYGFISKWQIYAQNEKCWTVRTTERQDSAVASAVLQQALLSLDKIKFLTNLLDSCSVCFWNSSFTQNSFALHNKPFPVAFHRSFYLVV